jgi:GH25 family lysozyme M1 (1,4-beta-N-acetylmuramidase)
MNQMDRRTQLAVRLRCLMWGIIGIIVGIMVGVVISNHTVRTNSEPGTYTELEHSVTMEPGEIAELVYENYWNFIQKSYIIVGNDRETCRLYKISANVPRHNYDVERFLLDDDGYMRYSDENIASSKLVIDISSHQGVIDWETLKTSQVDALMIRLGYRGYTAGSLAMDDYYITNITAANEWDIPAGVYFYTQAVSYEEGVEEANYVLQNIADYDISCPVVIDTEKMEVDDARANDITNEARTDAVVGFCETIKAAGYTPMIYANRNWYAESLDMDRLGDYELWLAQYSNIPDFPYLFKGWQYTSEGSIPGITGDVDINVWFD